MIVGFFYDIIFNSLSLTNVLGPRPKGAEVRFSISSIKVLNEKVV